MGDEDGLAEVHEFGGEHEEDEEEDDDDEEPRDAVVAARHGGANHPLVADRLGATQRHDQRTVAVDEQQRGGKYAGHRPAPQKHVPFPRVECEVANVNEVIHVSVHFEIRDFVLPEHGQIHKYTRQCRREVDQSHTVWTEHFCRGQFVANPLVPHTGHGHGNPSTGQYERVDHPCSIDLVVQPEVRRLKQGLIPTYFCEGSRKDCDAEQHVRHGQHEEAQQGTAVPAPVR